MGTAYRSWAKVAYHMIQIMLLRLLGGTACLPIYMGPAPKWNASAIIPWVSVLAAASERMVLLLTMKTGRPERVRAINTPPPAVQFKIEPFKHPVKMDPNYGGEWDSRVLSSSMPG